MDNNKIQKLFTTSKTNLLKSIIKKDKHKSHLPFSNLSNDDIKALSFNSNNNIYTEPVNIVKQMDALTLDDTNPDKYDFFTDIDENTALDTDFKYYDITEFNKMTQPIRQTIDFSVMHSNIQSLNCNGEKLECLLNSTETKCDVIALSETWHCEKNKHLFDPIKLDGYYAYEGQMGSSLKGGCGLYIRKGINYIPGSDLDNKIKNGNSEIEMKWVEIVEKNNCNKIIGVIYRHPNKKDIDFIPKITEILQKLNQEKKYIILSDGFNYDLLTYTKNEKVNEFITNMYENMFQPCITQPTRIVEHQRPSIIDNIFINSNEEPISGNLIDRISDHFPNFILIKNKRATSETITVHYKRNMKNNNPITFTDDLKGKFEATNYHNQNVNELNTNIINTFTTSLESPMEKVSKKEAKNRQKPWLTRGILNSIKSKTKWLKKFMKSKNTTHYKMYKLYRDKLNSLIKAGKRIHHKQYFIQHNQNSKKTWNGINELLDKKQKALQGNISLCINNKIITDQKQVANTLNKYFITIGENLSANLAN